MLNQARITELKDEVGEDDFAEVVALFCEEVEEVLGELRETARTELGAKLHFLKGSAFNLGLDAVGDMCMKEEARLRNDPAASADVDGILALYAQSLAQLLG